MEKIFICIMMLCSTGFISVVCWETAKDYDIKDEYLYAFTHTSLEDKEKTIASDKNNNHKGNRSNISSARGYHQIIYRMSNKYSIETSLISAVIKVESNWNSQAVSHKGAIGLMQLMPSTAKDMNVGNPFNPEDNIEGGTRYLRYLLDKFNGNLNLAIAAYNAGPGTIEKFRDIPPFKETQQYVKRILSIYNKRKLTL